MDVLSDFWGWDEHITPSTHVSSFSPSKEPLAPFRRAFVTGRLVRRGVFHPQPARAVSALLMDLDSFTSGDGGSNGCPSPRVSRVVGRPARTCCPECRIALLVQVVHVSLFNP